MHVIGQEGRSQGPVEWECDRGRFLGRGRGPENPQALDGRALSGTTGVLLDQRLFLAFQNALVQSGGPDPPAKVLQAAEIAAILPGRDDLLNRALARMFRWNWNCAFRLKTARTRQPA